MKHAVATHPEAEWFFRFESTALSAGRRPLELLAFEINWKMEKKKWWDLRNITSAGWRCWCRGHSFGIVFYGCFIFRSSHLYLPFVSLCCAEYWTKPWHDPFISCIVFHSHLHLPHARSIALWIHILYIFFFIYAFPIVIESNKRSVFIIFTAFVTVLKRFRFCSLECIVLGTTLIWYAQFAAIFFFLLLDMRILRDSLTTSKCFEKYVRNWYLKYNIRSQSPNDIEQPHLRFLPDHSNDTLFAHCLFAFFFFVYSFARNDISMKFNDNNFQYCFKWAQNNCRQKKKKEKRKNERQRVNDQVCCVCNLRCRMTTS